MTNSTMKQNSIATAASVATIFLGLSVGAQATQFVLSVDGTDAIYLAGRTDITVPDPSDPWSFLGRHSGPTPEEAKETFPGFIPVAGADVVKVSDPAVGGINFFNGYNPAQYYGPEGNPVPSSLTSLGGISGYLGTQGALVGVFLDDSVPNGTAPARLDFSTAASRDFLGLSPLLGQVFFIGDGQTSGGVLQEFTAPAGATRLFFGIPDGFGFNGAPGAYDDNDGSYRITVGVNEDPPAVPDGGSGIVLLGMGILATALGKSRWGKPAEQ